MTTSIGAIDIDFWSGRYPPETLFEYRQAMRKPSADCLRQLWGWKSLSRSKSPDRFVEQMHVAESLVGKEPTVAVTRLREHLRSTGLLADGSVSLVLPQFMLHVADSDSTTYSSQFPILDRLVWRAYRAGIEGDDETMPRTLTFSESTHQTLTTFFMTTGLDPAKVERALFMYGRSTAQQDSGRDVRRRAEEIRKATAGYY